MAEKKGVGHAYNVDFLNVVFAASSLFLFLSVIWMVWDDFDRDWKNTQRRFAQLEYEVTQAQVQQAARGVDRGKLNDLRTQGRAAMAAQRQNQAKVEELEAALAEGDKVLYRATIAYNAAKATWDQDRYLWESARVAGSSSADRMGEDVAQQKVRVAELNLALEKATADRTRAAAALGEYTGKVAELIKEVTALRAEEMRLRGVADVVAPSAVKDYFRDAPLLDFMAPSLKVKQIILPNVVDDVNFIRVPKMDRCQTCHLAIDRKGFESYPQPYTTHPKLEQYLGGGSPHPIDRVGCTVCHEGMGQSVDFLLTRHMPKDDKQKAEWEEKYHWHEPHEWDFPMLPTPMTEASCAKCHKSQVFVPGAERLNVAYETYERAGCNACHKTRGFDTDVRKPGPILTKIDTKLSQDWVKTWIRNPKAVKPTTWMPRFFYNSNNSGPEDAVRNEAEINAITAYLFANSEPHAFATRTPARGDATRGEEIVKSVGCQGCHVVNEGTRSELSPRRTFGQPLENIGNKTTYEWIYDWVRDPKHYSPATYMPDLRLTDAQVADVATYLSGLKATGGDAAKASPTAETVDTVLLDYLRAVMPFEDAKAQLAKYNAQEKQVELGRRAINRYGCFSCHDIKGFENAQAIGTDLSEEGSKLVTRLDFAFIDDIPHSSKIEWFRTKLHDPRIFDKGRDLAPLDKLRMPNFDFTDEEVGRLLVAIMSFQRDIQPPAALPTQTARYQYQTAGRTLVHRRNCVGCHEIEGSGGDLVKLVSEPTMGPPLLTPEGARVKPDWLYAFLRSPITIRPWINARMPTFGLDDRNLNGAISYFAAVSNTMGPFRSHDAVNVANATGVGKELFDLLKCQQCHVLGAIPKDQPTSNLAPDLRMAQERLQPDWIVAWLQNPATILPGTRMPAFWPELPRSFYPHLNSDGNAQILAIRDHLLTLRGGPSPRTAAAQANN